MLVDLSDGSALQQFVVLVGAFTAARAVWEFTILPIAGIAKTLGWVLQVCALVAVLAWGVQRSPRDLPVVLVSAWEFVNQTIQTPFNL